MVRRIGQQWRAIGLVVLVVGLIAVRWPDSAWARWVAGGLGVAIWVAEWTVIVLVARWVWRRWRA